jgi:hypothetical protein
MALIRAQKLSKENIAYVFHYTLNCASLIIFARPFTTPVRDNNNNNNNNRKYNKIFSKIIYNIYRNI